MPDSVCKVIEVIGASPTSWADAAKAAPDEVAGRTKDVRVGGVVEFDMHLDENKVVV